MLLTTHGINNIANKVLRTILAIVLITIGIITYKCFQPHKSLDGVWVSNCYPSLFHQREVITISHDGHLADITIHATSEGCDFPPSVVIHAKRELKQDLESIPNAILMYGTDPIYMKITTPSMVAVANLLNLYEYDHWKIETMRIITGKKYSYLGGEIAGNSPPLKGLHVDYNGDNKILITGTKNNTVVVLTRQDSSGI